MIYYIWVYKELTGTSPNICCRLVTGVLQLPQGSHLTFDETLLQSGSLTSKGVENTMLLKNLMESQKVIILTILSLILAPGSLSLLAIS